MTTKVQSNSPHTIATDDSSTNSTSKVGNATQTVLTNVKDQTILTSEASSMTFEPVVIDDKIDGKSFNTWGARVKLKESEEVKQDWCSSTINENSWPITKELIKARSWIYKKLTPDKNSSTLEKTWCYTLGCLTLAHPIKWASKGTDWAWKNSTSHVVNFHRRRWGFHNNLEFVGLTEEESKKVNEMLKHFWAEYKDKVDFSIKDVTSMYFKVPLKDGKPDLHGKFTFIAEVKQKEKDGKYKKDKTGNFVTKRKEIVRGHFSDNDEKDECKDFLLCIGKAVDFSSFPSRIPTYSKEKFETLKGVIPFFDPDHSEKLTESKPEMNKKSSKADPLICFAHTAKVLTDATKTPQEQEKEFAKSKEQRDKEATKLRKECFDKIEQQDVHEALIRSDLLGDLSRFSATTTHYIGQDSIGKQDEHPYPIPLIEIPPDNSLLTALNTHFDCTDKDKLPKWKDDREDSSTKGQELQITRKQTLYQNKPPFLMIAVKRFDTVIDQDTGKLQLTEQGRALTQTITTPLVVPEALELNHIQDQSLTKYYIKGFIHHPLDSTEHGHYITYIQRLVPNPNGSGNIKKWFKYDNLKDFGIEIPDSDTYLQQRKQKAYIYLYKDSED